MAALPTSISSQSFISLKSLTLACPGQYIHRSFWRWMSNINTSRSRLPIPLFTFCNKLTESVKMMVCIFWLSPLRQPSVLSLSVLVNSVFLLLLQCSDVLWSWLRPGCWCSWWAWLLLFLVLLLIPIAFFIKSAPDGHGHILSGAWVVSCVGCFWYPGFPFQMDSHWAERYCKLSFEEAVPLVFTCMPGSHLACR